MLQANFTSRVSLSDNPKFLASSGPWYIMWINIISVLCALVYLGSVIVSMYWARPLGNNCLSSERKIIVTYLVVEVP